MPKRTGGQIGILLAASAIAAVTEWHYSEEDVDTDTTSAGDLMEDSESLRGRFTITGKARLAVAAPYVIPTTLRGTKIAVALKVVAADTNPLIATTAKFSKIEIGATYKDAFDISFELKTAGVAVTWNLSPA